MNVYTYSEARQNLAAVLETAKKSGRVFIKRRDGSVFKLEFAPKTKTPFAAVKGIKTDITTKELLSYIRESREA
jgi:hypothetical protein